MSTDLQQAASASTDTHTTPDEDADEEPPAHAPEYARELAGEYDHLNLGCGSDVRDGYLNVDIDEQHDIDMAWDLDQRPWPWPDNAFQKVVMHNVLEHLADHLATLEELHRITQPGGTVTISGPHWNSKGAWIDPTHTRPFIREMFAHETVSDMFWIRDESCTTVRWGRLLPNRLALLLADHIGHGVSEIEVELGVRSPRAREEYDTPEWDSDNYGDWRPSL